MANFNKVFLMGNLTRDPQVSYLPSQTAVCELGLAVNRRWTGQDGQQKEEVSFVDVVAYGKQAETLGKYLRKGRPVFIEGRLKLDQWEAQDGTKRSKMRVVLEGFQFIDSRAGGEAGGADGGGAEGEPTARAPMRPAARPAPRGPARPGPASAEPVEAPPEETPPPNADDIPF
jgi:single-strand DNA-binding protein